MVMMVSVAKLETVDLDELPNDTSLSAFLSPAGGAHFDKENFLLTSNSKTLDSTHLVLLALNEECRTIGRGAFYHLPLRSEEHEARPCDVIYLPDIWSTHDTSSWDRASWTERLEMCKIG